MTNRTIKFRVFYDGKMIYPKQFLCDSGEIKACFYSDNEVPQIKGLNNDYGYEIMQFTGLLDKNGKEIYEGDIVKWKGKVTGEAKGVVEYDDSKCSFYCEERHLFPIGIYKGYDIFEIIGNIYENPNLLSNA